MKRALLAAAFLASATFAQTKLIQGPLPPHVRQSSHASEPRAPANPPASNDPTSPGQGADATGSSASGATAPTSIAPGANASKPSAASEPILPDVPAYAGTLAQGLAEMQRLSEAEKNDDALRIGDELLAPSSFLRWKLRASSEDGWKKTLVELADPVLDALGWNGAEPAERAAVHYARGLVQSRAGKRVDSEREFESARMLAGPGELRLDAIYNLGTTDLMEGEGLRAQIPEINGGKTAAGGATPNALAPPKPSTPLNSSPTLPPGAPSGAPGAPGQPPDPLELAKQAYLRARDHYVERLRADYRDGDARANTELVMRRLKELDEIRKKREEQKKQQEKQDQDKKNQDKQNDKDDKKDPQKQDDKKDKSDKDSKDKKNQDQNKPDDSKDQPNPDQKKPDEKKPDEKKDQPDEKKPDESKDKDQKDAQAGEEKEQLLSKEEVMRLLDRLKDIEDKAHEMQMQLRHQRRAKVKKDW
jgi:hypothetical protein